MQRMFRRIGALLKGGPDPAILMYHRVADLPYDPWGLAVTPAHFAAQLEVLRKDRLPLSMTEFVSRLEAGSLPRHAVAVTFDDGYLDNLTQAKPILDRAAVPATIFLTTEQLGQRCEFWWDELARMVLGRRAGVDGAVRIAGQSISVRLPPLAFDAAVATQWRAWETPRAPRECLYLETWQLLRNLAESERTAGMDALRDLFRPEAPDPANLPMERGDIARLGEGSAIAIGAHSATHRPLTTLSPAEQRQEIEGSRRACEQLAGHRVSGFAYPYGDRDADSMRLVRDLGFDWACSTHDSAVDPARFDRFDLPRRQVLDWDAAMFQRELGGAQRAA
jgi:peptidoglycan/xylan/chitin deacetylase (PgdA/CDA1 family)